MSADPLTQGTGQANRIGKYELVARIATGGMGTVYRALDTENNRTVALKVLAPELASKPVMLERFRREARSGLKLQHENVVTLYESGEADGTFFLAMEYVDGIDLHDYIDKKGPLDPEETRQIVLQAARALNHAHKQDIVHRDIKPSNFLLSRQGGRLRVKLTDMGLAREVHSDEYRVTRSGTTVGTVDYIAPEQARDSGLADIRSDLYSLGCSWYHMLAGQAPFPEGGLAERLLKHMTAEPSDIRRFNARVSGELVDVLRKLLAKRPEDRYQNPLELIQDLVSLNPIARTPVRRSGVNSVPRSARSGSRRRARRLWLLRRRKRMWMVAGVTAAVVVLALLLWLGVRHKRAMSEVMAEPPPSHSLDPAAAPAVPPAQ